MSLSRRLVRNRELLWLATILMLASLFRTGWPRLTEFKFSEARLEALALEFVREGRPPLVGVPSSAGFDHSPISVYFYLPAFLAATDPIPATIYSGLFGVAAVALCWWLGRRWPGGGQWAAPVSALLLAASPWAVAFSRKIWQVTFVPLLALTFVGLIVSALIQEPEPVGPNRTSSRAPKGKGRSWNLAWGLAAYALLVQIHPSAVALAPALMLWLIVFWRRVRLGPLLVGLVLGVLSALPFLLHQVQSDWPALAALGGLSATMWDTQAIGLAWQAITGQGIHALAGQSYSLLKIVPQLECAFALGGAATIVASAWLGWRVIAGWRSVDPGRRQAVRVDLVLLSWLLIPMLFNLRHSLDLHLHFFALIMPAAYLLVGRAVESIAGEVPVTAWAQGLKLGGLAAFGVLLAAQIASLGIMARFVATHDTAGGFGTPLGTYLDIADQTISIARDTNAAEILVVGVGSSPDVDEIPAIFDVLLRGWVSYRFVDGESAALFPVHRAVALQAPEAGAATQWYRSWQVRDLPGGYRLVILDGSWPSEGLEPISGSRTFQNGLELQGYRWVGDRALEGEGRFWLLWQVLWLNPDSSHFSIRLFDEQDQQWGQEDGAGYPTAYRRKGDRIISKFDITAKESYTLEPHWARLSVYLYPLVVDVPVIDGMGNEIADAIWIGPLEPVH